MSLCALPGRAEAQTEALDGRWVLFERDGEAELIATVAGPAITFTQISQSGSPPEALTRAADSTEPPYRWLTADRDEVIFTFLDPSGQTLIFQEVGDSDRFLGYRLAPLPAELNGAWILRPVDSAREIQLTIDSTAGTLMATFDGNSHAGTLEGIAFPSTYPHALALFPGPEGGKVFRFVPIGSELYFMGPVNEEDDGVLFRPGMAPPWLGLVFPPPGP